MSIRSYLTFKSGGVSFACEFEKIERIEPIGKSTVTPAPGFPSYMPGTAVIDGEVMPIISSALRFGLEDKGLNERSCYITADFDNPDKKYSQYTKCAFTADTVTGSLRLDEDSLLNPPSINAESFAEYVSGVFRVDSQTYYVVDPTKLVGNNS